MNERLKELYQQAHMVREYPEDDPMRGGNPPTVYWGGDRSAERFAELIIKEMCGMMEQTEDDCYHCFEPSERPTEYISWLNEWRTRFEQHFGVES
jgi:hypothetical protein